MKRIIMNTDADTVDRLLRFVGLTSTGAGDYQDMRTDAVYHVTTHNAGLVEVTLTQDPRR